MLTPSQHKALNTLHHLSVTANAGSGKTMVLVERYVDILTSGKAYVSEVVALTFTEKAASELKRKIAESVARKIAEATDFKVRNKLEEIRDQLSAALVGTIHSFCARMLREYPVEAGVDAAFTVLEGVDRQTMLEASLKETFDSILKDEEGKEKREQVLGVLRALGKYKVLTAVHSLALNRERVEHWILPGGLYARNDEAILAFWRETLSAFVESELNDAGLLDDLHEILAIANGKQQSKVDEVFKSFKRAKKQGVRVDSYAQLMERVLTQSGTFRRDFFGNAGEEMFAAHAERLHRKRELLAPLIGFVRDAKNDEVHRSLLSQSRILLELAQNVIERFEQKRVDATQLDFEDLQIRTKHLLQNDKIRARLSQRFKYIMVDEYQDTNILQYEILLPLVNHLTNGNLFIVGDPKQSIYGFRNADVAVFNKTKEDIERVSGTGSSVVLRDSFRLLRDIVAFVNLIFSPLMKTENNGYEVAYEPLIRGRQNDAPGRVELILRETPDDDVEEAQRSEGELIAQKILQLHTDKHQIYRKDETQQDVKFSDFAVLLRSRNGLAGLEDAFIRYNIPYLVSGGVGYFQTQGIYDVFNYFRFLLNTDDDVALVGILRSPFFNVSDAELYEISLEQKGAGLWERLRKKNGMMNRCASVLRAVEILLEDIDVASRLSVPDLVNRIVDQTAYTGFVAGTVRSGQMFANLEKLKRLARSYEDQGFTNLYDFVARLKRLIDEEEKEGQATVDVLADAVKIMTIHAAKGLEFPVVIIPGLERRFRSDNEPFFDDDCGIGFTPVTQNEEKESVPLAEFLKRKSRAKMIAEEKRIFYVACTRGRDMLILSGLQNGSRTSGNYMNWLLDGLGVRDNIDSPSLTFDGATEHLSVERNEFKTIAQHHRFFVHVVRAKDLVSHVAYKPSSLPLLLKPRLLIEPVVSRIQGEIFSASKIRTYVECPSKYYLRYVAGLPATSIRSSVNSIDDEHDGEITADVRGRAFHYIMEHSDSIGNQRKSIVAELKKFIARDSYSLLSEPSLELEEIGQLVIDVLGSAFWQEVGKATGTRTEFTIMSTLGNDYLTGTLDRVYCDADGVWNVLDYKTDAVTENTLQQKIDRYESQIKFYAFLVKKYFVVDEVRASLLFTSVLNRPVRFSYAKNDLSEFEHELALTISKMHSGKFHRAGKPCEGCPFAPQGCSSLID